MNSSRFIARYHLATVQLPAARYGFSGGLAISQANQRDEPFREIVADSVRSECRHRMKSRLDWRSAEEEEDEGKKKKTPTELNESEEEKE